MRRGVVIALGTWAVLSALALEAPPLFVLAFPLVLVAVLCLTPSAAELQEGMRRTRALRAQTGLLVVLIASAVVGSVASTLPGMAWHSKRGDVVHEYALSVVVAPALWAAVFIAGMRALIVPSPRRRAIAALAVFVTGPVLIAVRALREPWFDIDDQWVRLAPVHLYDACVVVASGIAVLVTLTMRRSLREVPEAPPRATALGAVR